MRAASEFSKFILSETVGSVLHFPLWWYSDGLNLLIKWMLRELAYRWKAYSFVIWMQNMFVPMYGQYDWSGRMVSFIMRFLVLVGRAIGILIEAIAYVFLLFVYVLAPPFALIMAVYSSLFASGF